MSNTKLSLLLSIVLLLVIVIYKLFFNKQEKITSNKPQENRQNLNFQANNNNQATYDDQKNKVFESFKSNIKNKLELSWQFLYDITSIVLKKFSQEDRLMIIQIGKTLLINGMRYQHVIEYGILNKNTVKVEQNKKIEITK
jgi:hypothetical protein